MVMAAAGPQKPLDDLSEGASHISIRDETKRDERVQGEVVKDPLRPQYSMIASDGRVKFKPSLSLVRYEIVADIIKQFVLCDYFIKKKVVDLGCSDKSFLMHGLLKLPGITEVVCLDQHLSKLVEEKRLFQQDEDRRAFSLRVQLVEADILTVPRAIEKAQVVTLIEVIEHFKVKDDLPKLLWIVFSVVKPRVLIVTTPNTDFNLTYPVPDGRKFRHHDHKFEWNTVQFQTFCEGVTKIYPRYSVLFDGCGYGASGHYCTQIAVFCVKDMRTVKNDGVQVNTQKGSIVEKMLTLNDEIAKKSPLDTRSTIKDGEPFPVPFPSAEEQGRELNENEEAVNSVLSQLHELAAKDKPSTKLEDTQGASAMNEPNTASSKPELKEDVESVVVAKQDQTKSKDSSKLKLSFKGTSVMPEGLPTPESPCTSTTPVTTGPSTASFGKPPTFSDEFHVVQDITYVNVETMYKTALLQEVSRFVWCCSSTNIYYPFKEKIEKCTTPWNFMDIYEQAEDGTKTPKKFLQPFFEKSNFSCKARKLMPLYTDEVDGACRPQCRELEAADCNKCKFVYFKKKSCDRNGPKMFTRRQHQYKVVYENYSATKLWFSFKLLHRYLGEVNQEILRQALSNSNNYTLVQLSEKGCRSVEYYCCVIGEEEEGSGDQDDDAGDDAGAGAGDEGHSCPPRDYSGSRATRASSRGGGGSQGAAPPSRARQSQGGRKRATSVCGDSLDSLDTRKPASQEGKSDALTEFLLKWQLKGALQIDHRLINAVPCKTVSLGEVEYMIAYTIASSLATNNGDRDTITRGILTAFSVLADITVAKNTPADRNNVLDVESGVDTDSDPTSDSPRLVEEGSAPTVSAEVAAGPAKSRLAASSSTKTSVTAAASSAGRTKAYGGSKPATTTTTTKWQPSQGVGRHSNTSARTTAASTRTTTAATARATASATRPVVTTTRAAASSTRTAASPADLGGKSKARHSFPVASKTNSGARKTGKDKAT